MIERILRELYARGSRGIRLGLQGMREACARLGHPERAFECVHIAGTNGKGSTSAMLESIARTAGKRTGLYTSPHLCRFAERIRIDGDPIADVELARVLRIALDAGPDLTFFEVATLAAFIAFRDAGINFAVLEVGLGGRLDATNVVDAPRVCAITSIGFDHMNLLGNTLAEIATEKAGIAKPGIPLVLAHVPTKAREAIAAQCLKVGAQLLDVTPPPFALPSGTLTASYQASNRVVAAHVARLAGFHDTHIQAGIQNARWPGRFEMVTAFGASWLLEGAHNLDGVNALLASDVREDDVLVFGALLDKPWGPMLEALAGRFPVRFYAEPKGRAATPHATLAAHHAGTGFVDVKDAIDAIRKRHPDRRTLVTGSLYLVGEARAHLLGLPMDPVIAL